MSKIPNPECYACVYYSEIFQSFWETSENTNRLFWNIALFCEFLFLKLTILSLWGGQCPWVGLRGWGVMPKAKGWLKLGAQSEHPQQQGHGCICGHRRRQVGPCMGGTRVHSFFIALRTLLQKFFPHFSPTSSLPHKLFLLAWNHAVISPILHKKNTFLTQSLTPVITPFFSFPLQWNSVKELFLSAVSTFSPPILEHI